MPIQGQGRRDPDPTKSYPLKSHPFPYPKRPPTRIGSTHSDPASLWTHPLRPRPLGPGPALAHAPPLTGEHMRVTVLGGIGRMLGLQPGLLPAHLLQLLHRWRAGLEAEHHIGTPGQGQGRGSPQDFPSGHLFQGRRVVRYLKLLEKSLVRMRTLGLEVLAKAVKRDGPMGPPGGRGGRRRERKRRKFLPECSGFPTSGNGALHALLGVAETLNPRSPQHSKPRASGARGRVGERRGKCPRWNRF